MFSGQETALTLNEAFQEYVAVKAAVGVRDKTLITYQNHWKGIGRHLDLEKSFSQLTRQDLTQMVVSMRKAGLVQNTVSSYVRVMKTFLNWCQEEG